MSVAEALPGRLRRLPGLPPAGVHPAQHQRPAANPGPHLWSPGESAAAERGGRLVCGLWTRWRRRAAAVGCRHWL